jgi:hypothetical protein
MVGMMIVNELSNKFDFRKYITMGCFCLNVAFLALIIKGIMYYSSILAFSTNLVQFSNCFVQQEQTTLAAMSSIIKDVSFIFIFFMGIIALLIFLVTVLLLTAKLI